MEALYDLIIDEGHRCLAHAGIEPTGPAVRTEKITAITGMRGAGKTRVLTTLGSRLLLDGVPLEQVAYFNLADRRLDPCDPLLPTRLLDRLLSRYPAVRRKPTYLLLDGADLNPAWPQALNRLLDIYDLHVVMTGERASWLRTQPGETLPRGSDVVELIPNDLGRLEPACIQNLLALGVMHQARIESLHERSTGRPPVIDTACCLELAALALQMTGRPFSTTAAAKTLHSHGWSTTRPQVDRLMGSLEEGHFIYGVAEFSAASKTNPRSAKRVYAGSTDLARACAAGGAPSRHGLDATTVYLHLRELGAGDGVYSYRVGETPSERARNVVDFAVGSPATGMVTSLIHMESPNRSKRDLPPLKDLRLLDRAMAQAGLRHAILVGPNGIEAQDISTSRGTVHRIPLEEALLADGIELG